MIVIGADIGKTTDPTALAVVEATAKYDKVPHLDRLPLGTPYPLIADGIEKLARSVPGAPLVIDATGVGRAPADYLTEFNPVLVVITGGRSITFKDGTWRVPKRRLLRPLITSLERKRLKVARGLPDADALQRELGAFQRTFGSGGHVKFAGKGEHDDLVIAVVLALWWTKVPPSWRAMAV